MATEIVLPQWSMGMADGTIVRWLKQEGDAVMKGEPLVEVEAAKVTSEVEAEVSGVLARILVAEGETVPVRTPLCLIGTAGEVIASAEAPTEPAESVTVASTLVPPAASSQPTVQVTPVARRMAKDHGIDLGQVRGSGPGGRITVEDVQRVIGTAAQPAPSVPPVSPAAGQVIALTGMRAAIARRMHQSLQTSAQVTLITEVDVSALVQLREEWKQQFSLTYTDLVVKAVARALKEHPRLNAWIEGEQIRLVQAIHIGVAVALDEGLIVPVVRDADRKSLWEIAQETQQLALRAREGTLSRDEVMGSTFSVTNLGMYGIDAFTPIINPPESAILGVGRINEKLVRVPPGAEWRHVMTLSLTFDHRTVDGAPAAAFLQTIGKHLENPAELTT
jgi:pyruvate dehydrogenase E2 component (dihydrolipoamide acetyltransferase)